MADGEEPRGAEATRGPLEPFVEPDGRVKLPAWYRALLATA